MAPRRFVITISIPGDKFHRDSRSITLPTLERAEHEARQWLLTARLTKWRGDRWNRWSVMTAGSPYSIPKIQSWGDQHGVQSSAYQAGWTD
jgi:hypothetical protein